MLKRKDYSLTETELEQIRAAIKHPDARVAKRATIIYNLHLGYTPKTVAQMHDLTVTAVYKYFNRFRTEGIDGLPNKVIGRPTKVNPFYIEQLEQTLTTDPHDLGYTFTVWTQPRLCNHLAQVTGITLGRRRFQQLMHQLGYRYHLPQWGEYQYR